MRAIAILPVLAWAACQSVPADPPRSPVGADAYAQWERWPMLRLGTRVEMRSSADPEGGNPDTNNFVRAEAPDRLTLLDVAGPGVLVFTRANHWHGSPWSYVVDGAEQVLTDTSTADPTQPLAQSVVMPTELFPSPLAVAWPVTAGADLNWVPRPFRSTLQVHYGRAYYGTGYFIYQRFPADAPIESWTAQAPARAGLDLLARAGEDLAPDGAAVVSGHVTLGAGEGATLPGLPRGATVIRRLRLSVPAADAPAFADARLRLTWDERAAPSVDAPVGLLFAAGRVDGASGGWLVRALPATVRIDGGRAVFSLYLPMPYFRSAQLRLDAVAPLADVTWDVATVPLGDMRPVGHLHATFHDHGTPTPGRDLVLLDTTVDEGGGDWCGSFIGTSFTFTDTGNLGTLEGDPRFFFDDAQQPQAQGTGTEEWGGGGDYWEGGRITTLPLAGHPTRSSAYRFLLADLFPFGRNARIQLEHGAVDDSVEHYRTVAYWYGLPGACLVPTDTLHVGDPDDEARHQYASPAASSPDEVSTRWPLGIDVLDGVELQPESADVGRHTTGTSELTLAIDPRNVGVLVRRKLDGGFSDQRAEVWVGDASPGATLVRAGTWYSAGSSTLMHAESSSELGAPSMRAYASTRRWREAELLLPATLTAGKHAIRLRLVYVASPAPLAPDIPSPPSAWSEFRYTAYSWILPAPR
jgi:hypothetical protein